MTVRETLDIESVDEIQQIYTFKLSRHLVQMGNSRAAHHIPLWVAKTKKRNER